ncbi:hypothetical protein FRC15_010325 [Serendipita sp. 397]|nr:hypothetical protein FRC15_010325 [Serendipita sp. 397]
MQWPSGAGKSKAGMRRRTKTTMKTKSVVYVESHMMDAAQIANFPGTTALLVSPASTWVMAATEQVLSLW